ncbi:penicillin-binding protein 1A [Metallumcola ferriviriculae]|uniref:Penicillin-binding protein 1A n=1 Tax=Metallumcola ferriviriculae TaxID=3039180 RepID=A0AAU0URP0_9FIRM|nr:penicillin-binding protein 1A [Desulfitibacteraceae bacterium MK1]
MAKKTKKQKRKLNIFRVFVLVFLLVTFIVGGAGVGFVMGVIRNLPDYKPQEGPDWNLTTFVFDSQAAKVAELHGSENRVPVNFERIPQDLKDAFVAIEDNAFYDHFGVNPMAIARALWVNMQKGYKAQGGSTITQQLAKNAFLKNPKKTYKRKIQEALLAIQLERTYTKDEIFNFYLNTIYFGHGANGVQAAAQTYFGKNIEDLTLAESALLAGVANVPGRYSPFINMEEAKNRRAIVLNEMVELDMISNQDSEQAKKEPIKLADLQQKRTYKYPYFMDHVIAEAERLLKENGVEEMQLYTGGLKIYTTLNTDIQEKIEEVYKNRDNFPQVNTEEPVQSAMALVDPHTGAVQGLIGGREHVTKRGLNRATQLKRQPGSSIKPVAVYAPALESGLSPATVVDDVPVSYPIPNQENYEPGNYDGRYRGLITMREAVRWSVNIPAVKFLDQIGVTTGYDFAKDLGLPLLKTDRNLSLALGGLTKGVSPLDMASAYGAFANKGVYIKPYAITMITDSDGNVLVENKPQKRIAMSESTAYLMSNILTTVVKDAQGRTGTGWRAAIPGWPVAGKTGTTQLTGSEFRNVAGNKDAWFAGFTPELAAVVWLGYDVTDKDHYLKQVYGGKYPALIWKAVMEAALKDVEPKPFEKPGNIIQVAVDSKSGLLPSELTPDKFIRTELFARGTEPQKVSDTWVEAEVCAESGKLPSPFCPDVITGVFLKRPIPYTGNKKVEDAELQVPTEVCDVHTNSTTVLLSTCDDPRHEGKMVLANIPAPGQEGGCPEELIVQRVFSPGTAPNNYCDIPEHQLSGSAVGRPRPVPGNNDTYPGRADDNSQGKENDQPTQVPPAEPTLFGSSAKSEDAPNGVNVSLEWKVESDEISAGQDVVYSIERWTDSSSNKYNIALTTETNWIDEKVSSSDVYYYRVTTIDVNTSLTSKSNIIKIHVQNN